LALGRGPAQIRRSRGQGSRDFGFAPLSPTRSASGQDAGSSTKRRRSPSWDVDPFCRPSAGLAGCTGQSGWRQGRSIGYDESGGVQPALRARAFRLAESPLWLDLTATMAQTPVPLRNPFWAAFLAWLFPGLGHFYQGRTGKGWLYFLCILSLYYVG